jgi:GNAT superfamily N-acetyltransferase
MTLISFHRPGAVRAVLAHGVAELRPLGRGEREPLLAVFAGMSVQSRANRYLVGMAELPASNIAALTDVDGCNHVAWLASVNGSPAGIARFVRTAPDTAEVAFEVVDAHQGRGLGTVLLDLITTVAASRGIRRARASVLPTNTASLRLVERVGITLAYDDGVLEGEGDVRLLDPAHIDRTAVLALARRHGQAHETRPCA